MSMTAAYQRTIDTTYRVHGEPATYSPRDGVSKSVTVVHAIEPAESGFESGARQTVTLLQIRASEVAEPKRGDEVVLEDGRCHEVRDAMPINRWEWELVVR